MHASVVKQANITPLQSPYMRSIMRSSLNIVAFCPIFPDGVCLIRLPHNYLQEYAAEKRTTGKEIRMFQYPFSLMCVWVVCVCNVWVVCHGLCFVFGGGGDARRRREIEQNNYLGNNTNNNQKIHEKRTISYLSLTLRAKPATDVTCRV